MHHRSKSPTAQLYFVAKATSHAGETELTDSMAARYAEVSSPLVLANSSHERLLLDEPQSG